MTHNHALHEQNQLELSAQYNNNTPIPRRLINLLNTYKSTYTSVLGTSEAIGSSQGLNQQTETTVKILLPCDCEVLSCS